MTRTPDSIRRLVAALDDVDIALADNIERGKEARRHVRRLQRGIERGATVQDLMAAEPAPRAVELISANAAMLETAGAAFRARLAHALRAEGLTIEAIADMYGVSRQRISALLKQSAGGPSA